MSTNTTATTTTTTTSTTTSQDPLVLYDISSPLEPQSYAPNPSKARLTLSFKNLPFTTQFVDILSIPSVRQSLSCPATRTLDDGSDYFTLPMVRDPSTTRVWGDTFDIANALEDLWPESGEKLFPAGAKGTGLDYQSPHKDTPFYAPLTTNVGSKNATYAQFNLHVDATFTAHVLLVAQQLPFNPATAAQCREMFARRAHLTGWEQLACEGELRKATWTSFERDLGVLAEYFEVNKDGPFLEGSVPTYADLIVGGWLNYFRLTLREGEWSEMRAWHGGVWGRLWDVLEEKYWKVGS